MRKRNILLAFQKRRKIAVDRKGKEIRKKR